jgi:hypothetical protein
VWVLRKALYGLKQSAYLWYEKLRSILVDIGFRPLISDPCVFIRRKPGALSMISTHVDDLGLFCSSVSEVKLLKSQIRDHVPIKDLEEVSTLLGIEIIRDRKARTISLSHRRYIIDLARRYRLEASNPVYTPMERSRDRPLSKADCPVTDEQKAYMADVPYQSAVGAVLHAAIMTRPDIAHSVGQVAQFASNPGKAHWTAVKRIIQYLYTTRNLVLTLGGESNDPDIFAFCDADHGNAVDHGNSISGHAVFFVSGSLAWASKKQTATALSTGEAEYYSATYAGRVVIWLRQVLDELAHACNGPTPLYIDNTSAITMIGTPNQISNRTKHIKIQYHWIRGAVRDQTIATPHVPSTENVADIFTKILFRPDFERLRTLLGMRERDDIAEGE